MPENGWATAVVVYVDGHGQQITLNGVIWNSAGAVLQSGASSAGSGSGSVSGQRWHTAALAGIFIASGTQIRVGWTRPSTQSMEFSTGNGGQGYVAAGSDPGSLGTLGAPAFGGAIGAYIVYTSVGAPTAGTAAASSIASTTATLNGDSFPNGLQTTWSFQWGTTTSYGNTLTGGAIGTNGGSTPDTLVSTGVTGLLSGATYHYRLVAVNAAGTAYGPDRSFTTNGFPNAPTLTAPANNAAISLWQSGATFSWTYNTGGAGGGQTAYALAIIVTSKVITGVSPAPGPLSSWLWWTGSGWSVTETFITSAAASVAIAAGNFDVTVASYSWTVNTKDVNGTGQYATPLVVINEISPAAPTLISPASASYADLSGTPTFTWTYNPVNGVGGETNWALRRKISGAATYSYYNLGSTSWQSTIVWNAGSAQSYTFLVGAWTNGNAYNWSVATQDAGGQSQFAADFSVVAEAAPTVTVTSPTGTIASSLPPVAWSATFPGGAGETAYQVRTFSSAQYGAGGFNPATSAASDDSGVLGSSAVSYQVATNLPPGLYRSYVNVTETGGVTNAFNAFTGYTVVTDTPNAPSLVATPSTDAGTGCPLIQIQALCGINVVSAVDSSFETGIGTFSGTNCALAQSATQFLDGAFSLRLTASANGDMWASSGLYAVGPSSLYQAVASFRTSATVRSVHVSIFWYTSGSVLITSSVGTNVNDASTGWTQATITGTSPSNAAFALVQVYVVAAATSEIHYVDNIALFPSNGNLLSAVDASFETGIGTWIPSSCTIASSVAQALDGTHSLSMTATGTAGMGASSNYYGVAPSVQYTAVASVRAATTSRNLDITIQWADASLIFISLSTGTLIADANTGWQQVSVTANSPVNAAFALVIVTVRNATAVSEVHYIDEVALTLGASTTWIPGGLTTWNLGGFLPTAGLVILRSDGAFVRNASPANPYIIATYAPLNQTVTVSDYEATPLVPYTYTAYIQATGGSGVVQSPTSLPVGVSLVTTKWWELDPLNPSSAVPAQPITWNPSNTEQASSHIVLGQQTQVVVSYAMQNTDMTATMETFSSAVYAGFLALALSQKTIFFSSPFGTGYYFRIAPGGKAHDTQLLASTSSGPHQTLAIVGIAQPRPPV